MSNQSILVLTSTYPRWSDDTTPKFVESLCEEYVGHGYEVLVLAPHYAKAKKNENSKGINVFRFRYAPSHQENLAYEGGLLHNIKDKPIINTFKLCSFIFFQFVSALFLLHKYKITVIHAHWLVPQGFVAVLIKKIIFWRRINVLVTVHGGDAYGIKGSLYEKIKKWICNSCDSVTAVSEAVASSLGLSKKVFVRSMGVSALDYFVPLYDHSRKDLLFVGRLVDKKGCSVLLEAMQIVLKSDPDVKLHIIGDGPELEELKNLCSKLSIKTNVIFLGAMPQKEILRWYQTASVFIMPSIIADSGDQEGLGLVAAEAMSCKCPVIASDLMAVRDLVTNDLDGLLVNPNDKKDLANAIVKLLRNPEIGIRLGNNAREKIVSKFDWSVVGDEYMEEINRLGSK